MPNWKRLVRRRLKLPLLRNQRAERIVEELAGQIEDLYAEARRQGAPSRYAMRAALAQVENWNELSERIAEAERPNLVPAAEQRFEDALAAPRRGGVMGRLFGGLTLDARIGFRRLTASRSSTAIAMAVLSLAIGAGTAVFSVVDAVVLRGLPFDEGDRLVAVLETDPKDTAVTKTGRTTSQTYLDWRRMQTSFEGLACTEEASLTIRNELGEPAVLRGLAVTSEFLSVLRVQPMLGRPFRAGEEERNQPSVVILSYGLWQRQFGGARDVIGRTTRLFERRSWEIVGVMPRGFTYPLGSDRETDFYVPLALDPALRVRDDPRARIVGFDVIGRLRPGVSLTRATGQMNTVAAAIDAAYPAWRPRARVRVARLHEHLVGAVRAWMLLLIGAVGAVLGIACANVGNVRVAQAMAGARDLAIRAALGASRWRTTRAFLVENLMLAGASAVLGVAFAWGGVRVLKACLPQDLPRIAAVDLDLRVLGAAVAAALATGLLVGLAPSLLHVRGRLFAVTKGGGPWSTPGTLARRIGDAFVVGEVALAAVLLVAAGLFVASFTRLMQVDPGFDHRGVLSLGLPVPLGKANRTNPDAPFVRGRAMAQQVREAVRAVPGVVGADVTDGGTPLSGVPRTSEPVTLPGRGELRSKEDCADTRAVTPGYLALLRVPLLRGRHLSPADRADTTPVVVINQAAARKYWPGQDALGQRVTVRTVEHEVVGIVGNIRHDGPELPVRQEFYLPLAQSRFSLLTLAVRTAGDPLVVLPAVRRAIWSVLPGLPFFDETVTLEAFMDRLTARRRFSMALLSLFGVLGLAIAAVGVYGVLAHRVAQRTREIGIRMALGATPGGVVRMVLGQAVVLLGFGLALGLWGAWQFGAGVKAFLFGTEAADPLLFAAALLGLAAAGLLAGIAPARRASRVDPIVTLRCE
jgi:putative ABC transport system permease protein